MATRTKKQASSKPSAKRVRAQRTTNGNGHAQHEVRSVSHHELADDNAMGMDYKNGTVRLSAGLAETVAGMLISAVVGNAKHQEKIKGHARYTREYQCFAEMDHPKEVQEWIKDNFRSGGPGLAAIESQIEIYVDELSAWMDNALRYHKGHWCMPFCNCVEFPEQCTPP